MDGTYVMIGCGRAKQDIETEVPAEELYTSTYFDLKKRYAEAVSHPGENAPDGTTGWTILSAKHDVLWPNIEVEPYDVTIEDLESDSAPVEPDAYQHTRYPWDEPLYETRLDFWTRRVHFGLASWLGFKSGFPDEEPHCNRLYVVAGDRYIEPLLENDVFKPFPWETRFPFQEQDFDGIGEQMAWLKEEAEFYEETRTRDESSRQSHLRSYRELDIERPDVEGQSEWSDWM